MEEELISNLISSIMALKKGKVCRMENGAHFDDFPLCSIDMPDMQIVGSSNGLLTSLLSQEILELVSKLCGQPVQHTRDRDVLFIGLGNMEEVSSYIRLAIFIDKLPWHCVR
ncbi:hypothetical protein HAX54_005175 [Datura stramonium]|uniref:Uncharacterized protein n=1 Tax=Datura stramonium TaxID=4076 RepID=A0ABS8T893_DATST|nr:hypothetical protein [Datura stramonium]